MLPLTNEELLEVLVTLAGDESETIRGAAQATLDKLDPESLIPFAGDGSAGAEVLAFLCLWPRATRELLEAVIFNPSTPDGALAQLASRSRDPRLIEAVSLKQQSLIASPDIINAILTNPNRSFEAERRAREVREEFFEKQFGARMIADEQRARADAGPRIDRPAGETVSIGGFEDLVRLGLIEEGIDDKLITEYEEEHGPFETSAPCPAEQFDIERVLFEATSDPVGQTELNIDRIPVYQRVALMSVKDRVMLAIKGTREARTILVRDPNRVVAGAVLRNPRLTDNEIENIASFRTAPEEVLRQIGQNRAWARSYVVIHNLVRNPRTPIATSLGFLSRIQTRDLRALAQNKNIPDVIRQSANRQYLKRTGN